MRRATTEQSKEQRRKDIVQAALDEFFERGFAAARMTDIAKRAGVTKGTLYLYYPSKDALFGAVIDTVAAPRLAQMEELAQNVTRAQDVISALMQLGPTLVRQTALPRIIKILVSDGNAFPPLALSYREQIVDRVLALVSGVIERGQQNGEFRMTDPKLTARLVVAPVVMSAVWSVLFERHDKPVDLEALFELHRDILLRALLSVRDSQS